MVKVLVKDWFETEAGEMSPEELAKLFHDRYEFLAPAHGYKTREASAVPWEDVPEKNRELMMSVARAVLLVQRQKRFVRGGHQQSALLGLATTRELLDEITARIEITRGGLDYRTVDGE